MKFAFITSALFLSLSLNANSETLKVRLQCGFAGPELTATVITPSVTSVFSSDDGSTQCISAAPVQVLINNYTYTSSNSFLVHNEVSYITGTTKWDPSANGCNDTGFYGEVNVTDQNGFQGQLFYTLDNGKLIPRELSDAQQTCSIVIIQ